MPSEPVPGSPRSHRESRILVIGGGVLGCAAAHELLKRGHVVTVVEQEEAVGLGCSYANGGVLTPSMPDPWNAPGAFRRLMYSVIDQHSPLKLRPRAIPSLLSWGLRFLAHSTARHYRKATLANFHLAAYSTRETGALREIARSRYCGAARGTLKLFRDKAAMTGPAEIAQMLADEGLSYTVYDADEAVEAEPALSGVHSQIAGALFFPEDESGDAHLFCRALAEEITMAGGEIRTGVTATKPVLKNGRIAGLLTSDGQIDADHVVVAAGTASPALAANPGVTLPIKPAKGYSLTVDATGLSDLPRIPVIDDALHAAVTPLGNRLRLVGAAEFAGFDPTIPRPRIRSLSRFLRALYPHLGDRIDPDKGVAWAGFRPMSADGIPFVGPTRIPGLWVNCGHSHLGWTMAIGSAKLLADLLCNTSPEIDPRPYRVDR